MQPTFVVIEDLCYAVCINDEKPCIDRFLWIKTSKYYLKTLSCSLDEGPFFCPQGCCSLRPEKGQLTSGACFRGTLSGPQCALEVDGTLILGSPLLAVSIWLHLPRFLMMFKLIRAVSMKLFSSSQPSDSELGSPCLSTFSREVCRNRTPVNTDN